MREQLCLALAQYAGQTLTMDIGKAIVQQLFPERGIDPMQFKAEITGDYVLWVESFRAIIDELRPLHDAHFEETERARAGIAFLPDEQYRFEQERAGKLIQFTARELGTRRLVGNVRMYLYQDTHAQCLCANEDTLYLLPEARKGMLAINFIKYVERCLAQLGVVDVFADTKILFDEDSKVVRDIGLLMEFLQWQQVSKRFMKRLNPPPKGVNHVQLGT